jgi:hypothetical protein
MSGQNVRYRSKADIPIETKMRLFPRIILTLLILACPSLRAEVVKGTFHSSGLGVTKEYRVYLPAEYRTTNHRYPVIYFIHGWGVTESYWVDVLALAQTADAMKFQAIIVMPDGDRSFYANSASSVDYHACLSDAAPRHNKQEPRKDFFAYERLIMRITSSVI